MENLADLIRLGAMRWPDSECVTFAGRSHTYREFGGIVGGVTEDLRSGGIGSGDAVVTIGDNSEMLLATYLAIAAVGALNVPVNAMSTAAEIVTVMVKTAAKRVVYTRPRAALVEEVKAYSPGCDSWVELPGEPGEDLSAVRRGSIPDPVTGGDDPAMVIFTSGSTGRPKGVVKSHTNLLWHTLGTQIGAPRYREDRELYTIPLAGIGVANFAVVPMLVGAALVLDRFEPKQTLDHILNSGITRLFLAPTMLHDLVAAAGDLRAHGVVRQIDTGFEYPLRLRHGAVELFGEVFRYGYGSSEGTSSYGGTGDFIGDPQCVGWVFGLDEIALMDAGGELIPPGETGEIVARGPSVFSGYLGEPELTAESIKDGWFHTGDLGVMDATRRLYFTGRIKDVIKTGGMNVAATEVELAISEHPGVEAVSVVGIEDERWGEAVAAAVVVKPGSGLSQDDLASHAQHALPSYKRPKHWVLLHALPLNPTGKVAKGAVRDLVVSALIPDNRAP